MKANKHIKSLSNVLSSTGLGIFLIVGLTGCTSSDKCKDLPSQNLKHKEECKNQSSGGTIFPVFNSGYFGSNNATSHSESQGG